MAERQATCPECGTQFSYAIGRGTTRKYCGRACSSAVRMRKIRLAMLSAGECQVEGCDSRVRSPRATLCEKHYTRNRRNGTTLLLRDVAPPPLERIHTHGYVQEYAPDHPLGTRCQQSRIYQHRLRFYERHGEGPFDCHWCGCTVTWGDMHVDHLNGVKDDNRASNLVASCPTCNQGRAREYAAQRTREAIAVHVFEHDGMRLTAAQWAARLGISRNAVLSRINRGWPMGRALTEPRGKSGPISQRRTA